MELREKKKNEIKKYLPICLGLVASFTILSIIVAIRLAQQKSQLASNSKRFSFKNYNQPIDAVITWVSSDDVSWVKSFHEQRELYFDDKVNNDDSVFTSRFRDRGELRCCLKSIEKNVPWVRHIYIVSGQDSPSWVNLKAKSGFETKIKWVYHSDIFPNKSDLPTFNSQAIESNVFRIKGLSEVFLYLNDDFYIVSPCKMSDFITRSGKLIVRTANYTTQKGVTHPKEYGFISAWKNSNRILDKMFTSKPRRSLTHSAYVVSKQIIKKLWDLEPEVMEKTSASKFRSINDVNILCSLSPYYMLENGYAKEIYNNDAATICLNLDVKKEFIKKKEQTPSLKFLCSNDCSFDRTDNAEDLVIEKMLSEVIDMQF